jgi:hypothetical protein
MLQGVATVNNIHIDVGTAALDGLLLALQRLDDRLAQAVDDAHVVFGSEAASDHYRGLYVGQSEIARLLTRLPAAPALAVTTGDPVAALVDAVQNLPALAELQRSAGLDDFEVAALLVALAPDLDLRYERLYAFLQDDVSRRRPCVDLVLNLLCVTATEKLIRRAHFAPDAPLIRHGLLRLVADPNQIQPPLLAHYLKVDQQIVRVLLGEARIDERLRGFCQLIAPASELPAVTLSPEVEQTLPLLIRQVWGTGQPLRLYFHGLAGAGQQQAAQLLAHTVAAPILFADLSSIASYLPETLPILFREARFRSAILYLDNVDAVRANESMYRTLLNALAEAPGVTIVAGRAERLFPDGDPCAVMPVAFSVPAYDQRRRHWQRALHMHSVALADAETDALADRYRLTYDQITGAVATATNRAWYRSANAVGPRCAPDASDLFAAARAQAGHDLDVLTHKVTPIYTWPDLVLPDTAMAQLRQICQRVVYRQRVLGAWGFGRRLASGRGVNALFAGPSGAGKTMAAEVIANALQLDLYTIDLSGVVSKYIGETEKNLDRIFTAAENANAILFFDEADALFGKRSEVRDSHDRYANIEISYILQKMEQYDGIAILATNLRGNLDDAFIRRLAFAIYFPFPDVESRRRIWDGLWPAETPRAADVDSAYLAQTFALSGGNIKNIALAAAFLAAADGSAVTMADLLRAVVGEYQKMGKHVSEDDLLAAYRERANG